MNLSRCNTCTFQDLFREAQKLQGASSTLTIFFTTVSLSILCCSQGLHQDSKKQWKAEHPRLTSIINSSRMSPKASGTFFPQAVLLLFFPNRVISSVTSDETLCVFLFSTEQTTPESVDEPGRAAGVDSDDSDDVIVSPSRPVRRREVLIS